MRTFSRLVLSLLLCGLVGIAQTSAAQDSQDLRSQPGFVDFSAVESWFDTDATVEINLKGPLLDLVASASRNSDPEFSELIQSLKAIQVRGYPAHSLSAEVLQDRANQMTKMLEDQGWEQALYVREGDETSYIYVRHDNDTIAGLTILSTDPDTESVFVNIVGSIRPEQIQQLGQELDIDSLENLDANQ